MRISGNHLGLISDDMSFLFRNPGKYLPDSFHIELRRAVVIVYSVLFLLDVGQLSVTVSDDIIVR